MSSRIISSNTFGNGVQIHQGDVYYASCLSRLSCSYLDGRKFANPRQDVESPESKVKACRDALFLADPIVDREILKSTKGQRTAGTCEWIRDNEAYQSWLNGDSQCLWISGGPGKGKTMLSIFLTEELERRTQETETTELLLFYFCTADEKHNSAMAIFRGLAYQLVSKRPSLANHVLSDFESPEKTQEALKSPNALWIVLKKLLQAPDLGTVFCVLDGLDECDNDSSTLLIGKFYEYFSESSNLSGGQFKLAIISRKIDRLDAFPQIKLDPDNDEHVKDDIRHYISSSVQRLERIQGFNDIRVNLEATLLDRAQGTFLWVGFVVEELSKKQTCTEIMETLNGIPRGLHAIYGRMLMQIEASRRPIIIDILRWVTIAVRPLTLHELMAVIHIPSTGKTSNNQAILDYITLCGHILTVHNQQVSLIHQSARDYLLQKSAGGDPILKEFHITEEETHATIADMCLDCLEKSDLRYTPLDIKDALILQKSPLLHYAAKHWPDHARRCSNADSENLLRLSRAFFQEKSTLRIHWWQSYRETESILDFYHLGVFDPALLHIASHFGINILVQKLLTKNAWYNRFSRFIVGKPLTENQVKGQCGSTALSLAAREGHLATVQLLLANGADDKDGKALEWAAGGGQMDIVQLLIAKGADVKDGEALRQAIHNDHLAIVELLFANGADDKNSKALEWAAGGGHMDIVQLLIAKGADDKDGKVLEWAAGGGHKDIMQLLLANGADGKDGKALEWAAGRGQMDIVQLLIAKGADIKNSNALREAAGGGHMAIVQLLIAKGADVKDSGALREAINNDHMAIIRLLLAKGADYKDGIVLEWAAGRGHMDIVELLLANGADVKNPGALREAVYHDHTAIVELLLANGADYRMAQHLAAYRGRWN